jgi:DNA-binding winged helix-turn-helix (wHTH) protein
LRPKLRAYRSIVRIQFGDCTLDFDTREISRDGKPVHVEPKAYRLLELLLAVRPKALSKDDLQDKLWPKTFVSERSLARLVGVLRACLGDSAEDSRLIRTVHGFGYAFCGEVTETGVPSAAPAGVPEYRCRIVWGEREYVLSEGENVIGRDPAVSVWIDLASVSRRHARIRVENGAATLEDLRSRNGTYLREERISAPAKLASGDRMKVGAATLVFRRSRPLGTTESEISTHSGSKLVR